MLTVNYGPAGSFVFPDSNVEAKKGSMQHLNINPVFSMPSSVAYMEPLVPVNFVLIMEADELSFHNFVSKDGKSIA